MHWPDRTTEQETLREFATPQERVLLDIVQHKFTPELFEHIVAQMDDGRTPAYLAIASAEHLLPFANAWLDQGIDGPAFTGEDYRQVYFDALLLRSQTGDLPAIMALPKFAIDVPSLTTAMELVVANADQISAEYAQRPTLQYLASLNPQHIGHRIGIASALQTEPGAQCVVHVMGEHPLKPSYDVPYDQRVFTSESRLTTSPFIDNDIVTQIDLPGGVGLAQQGVKQMELIAALTSDSQLRWLIGSDKFIKDVEDTHFGIANAKARYRLSHPRVHVYVIDREPNSQPRLETAAALFDANYGRSCTLVREIAYDGGPASSTLIRERRRDNLHALADQIELYEWGD